MRHQGGRKGPFGQPGDTREGSGTTREAGKDQLDSLGGTRDALGRQERTTWTASEAPGRQERTIWTAGRHQGGTTAWEAPGRHQGDSSQGAGFCITFNAISMAIGPVRGKSWGGLHGWLSVAQTGL